MQGSMLLTTLSFFNVCALQHRIKVIHSLPLINHQSDIHIA